MERLHKLKNETEESLKKMGDSDEHKKLSKIIERQKKAEKARLQKEAEVS